MKCNSCKQETSALKHRCDHCNSVLKPTIVDTQGVKIYDIEKNNTKILISSLCLILFSYLFLHLLFSTTIPYGDGLGASNAVKGLLFLLAPTYFLRSHNKISSFILFLGLIITNLGYLYIVKSDDYFHAYKLLKYIITSNIAFFVIFLLRIVFLKRIAEHSNKTIQYLNISLSKIWISMLIIFFLYWSFSGFHINPFDLKKALNVIIVVECFIIAISIILVSIGSEADKA